MNIKTGEYLIAVDPCNMEATRKRESRPTLTVGKTYLVRHADRTEFMVVDNEHESHWFNQNKHSKYFKKK